MIFYTLCLCNKGFLGRMGDSRSVRVTKYGVEGVGLLLTGTLETVVQVLSYQNLFFGKIFNPILNIQCLI
jgi:hypothetical protein